MKTPSYCFTSEGNVVSLICETPSRLPFGAATRTRVPFDDWIVHRPATASAALARILQAIGDDERGRDDQPMVVPGGEETRLHPDFVAQLSDSEASALSLPRATRLALTLRSRGLIQRDGFRIDTEWTRAGGVPALTQATGNGLRYQQQAWRIPEPLWSTLAVVQEINDAPDANARQAGLARLKRIVGQDGAAQIRPDGIIERLRLHYAAGFSLSLNTSAGGIDFDPVLFAPERIGSEETEKPLDEEADALLPPALTRDFAQRFRAGDGSRRSYLMADGSLLFIDPQLGKALGVVRRAQSGSAEQRRAFAASPQRHIAQALGEAGEGGEDTCTLFVETQQFSDRVAGIDVWRKPVLPWIKPKPNSWLPESFGLRVGEPPDATTIEIAPERLEYAIGAAQEALRLNEPTFAFDGHVIPATQATVGALASLGDLDAFTQADVDPQIAPEAVRQRYFLQVRDNLEDVAYEPLARAIAEPDAAPPARIDMPAALRTAPKPHQITGVEWLVGCWTAGLPGALLADDMGLGKTWQALAFLAWIKATQAQPKPMLIVAPTGLLANWKAEIARHLEPDALGRVVSAYGAELGRLRAGQGRDIDTGSTALPTEAWSQAGIVLTTYETLRDYHMSFARQPFAAILYDEAQKLKNPASQLTRAAKTLNARFQLALTGTPVENRLQDLWSILDVIHPGMLGSSKAFEDAYPAQAERLKDLHDLLTLPRPGRPPVLLRRLKEECLGSLPAKHVRMLPVEMPPRQAQAYDRAIAKALVVKGTGQRGRMLEVLHMLRGVSLHPVAPDDAGDDSNYFADSARIATLFALLEEIRAKEEKVLIFCESLPMQALLAAEIRRRFDLGHEVARIHGGVPGPARQTIVDAFQQRPEGFDAMILSPKAGGVGLTLTAANHVVHLSRWWNPAVEDQATDRAYRIGQNKDVTVYLPQAVHPDPAVRPTSFDLMLHELMERKRVLSRGLLAPADDLGEATDLFDRVVVEVPQAAASEHDGHVPEPFPAPTSDEPVPDRKPEREQRASLRGKLGLRPKPAPPPVEAAAVPRRSGPPRVVYEQGQARDMAIFLAPLEGEIVDTLIIVDPYAAAGVLARRRTVEFAKMLLGPGGSCSSVQLTCFVAEDVETYEIENGEAQFDDMQAKWSAAFPQIPLHFRQESKRGNRSLHDREVTVKTRSERTLVWDLGRGIDGVMAERHQCRVNFSEL